MDAFMKNVWEGLEFLARFTGVGISLPKQVRGVTASSSGKTSMQDLKEHKKQTNNQGNTPQPKEHSNFPVTDPKEMKIYKHCLTSNSK